MRDRLIELLEETEDLPICQTYEGFADYLIANGVIVLPKEIEKLWLISENGLSVTEMILKEKIEQALRKE